MASMVSDFLKFLKIIHGVNYHCQKIVKEFKHCNFSELVEGLLRKRTCAISQIRFISENQTTILVSKLEYLVNHRNSHRWSYKFNNGIVFDSLIIIKKFTKLKKHMCGQKGKDFYVKLKFLCDVYVKIVKWVTSEKFGNLRITLWKKIMNQVW
jgi:hypothetical protein